MLDRIVAMLTKLGRRGYTVREAPAEYFVVGIDSDADSDSDPEGKEAEQQLAADAAKGAPLEHGVRQNEERTG